MKKIVAFILGFLTVLFVEGCFPVISVYARNEPVFFCDLFEKITQENDLFFVYGKLVKPNRLKKTVDVIYDNIEFKSLCGNAVYIVLSLSCEQIYIYGNGILYVKNKDNLIVESPMSYYTFSCLAQDVNGNRLVVEPQNLFQRFAVLERIVFITPASTICIEKWESGFLLSEVKNKEQFHFDPSFESRLLCLTPLVWKWTECIRWEDEK